MRLIAAIVLIILWANQGVSQINVINDCGAIGNGVADDWGAIQSCIERYPGRHLFFPKTQPVGQADYFISLPLKMNGYEQWLDGEVGSGHCYGGVQIRTAQTAIIATQVDNSIQGPKITNLRFDGRSAAPGSDGIQISAHGAVIEDVCVWGYPGHGIHIVTQQVGENANNWFVSRVRLIWNGGDGLHIQGGDTSAGVSIRVDSSFNKGWGINDQSFLGNTHVQPHAEGNGAGPYNTATASVQMGTWINPYAEGGQPPANFGSGNFVIGGATGSEFNGPRFTQDGFRGADFWVVNPNDGNSAIYQKAGKTADAYKLFIWLDYQNRELWRTTVLRDAFSLGGPGGVPTRLHIAGPPWGQTVVNAVANGAVELNSTPGSSQNGVRFYSGGNSPKLVASVDGAGAASFTGVRLQPQHEPICTAALGGTLWYVEGVAGEKDSLDLCAKDASGAWKWRRLF